MFLLDSFVEEGAQSTEEATMDTQDRNVASLIQSNPPSPSQSLSPSASPCSPPTIQPSLNEISISGPKICSICNENPAKYKCPRCYLPSCSVACTIIHKATHPALERPPTATKDKSSPPPPTNGHPPRAGTFAAAGFKGPFAALDTSQELQDLFKRYPNLPAQLDDINTAMLPPIHANDGEGAVHSNYLRAAGRSSGRREQAWNQDRGYEHGREALNRAREAYGEDGEGVREYCELVLRIVARSEGFDAVELMQREVEEENKRIIEQLLNGEI